MIVELFNAIGRIIANAFFGIFQAIVVIIVALIAQIVESRAFKSCVELSRPLNSAMASLFVAIVAVMSGTLNTLQTAMAMAVVVCMTAAGNAVNDYFDRKIDAINKPKRPIPAKRIRANFALGFSVFLFALGILMASFLNSLAFLIVLINTVLLFYYAKQLKRSGFIGNIAVSYLTGSTFLFAGAVVNTVYSWSIGTVLAVCAFFVTAGREIY